MRHILPILVLLFAAQIASAAEVSVLASPRLNPLEERLFADAADGRLDEFSPLDAALVVSGIEDVDSLRRYGQKAAALVEQLRNSDKLADAPRERVEAIFDFMHSRVLRGGYDLKNTDLRRVLDEGHYNCVTATVLFNYLAGRLGLNCRGLQMPGHAMSRLLLADGPLDVETTCPRWFQLADDPRRRTAIVGKTIGAAAAANPSKARQVSPIQLAAMIYYNRGVDLLAEKRFAEAAAANTKALRLDPASVTARGNLLATINNWSIELGNRGEYAEAVRLLRQGMAMDAEFAAFLQNYVHVHRQWVEHLCREGRFEEALEILSSAAAEMPEVDYLVRAQDEVCRYWSKALAAPHSVRMHQLPCVIHTPPVD